MIASSMQWFRDLFTSGKGVWRLAQNRMFATGKYSALPTAGANFRGAMARTEGSPDTLQWCGSRDGGTNYTWSRIPLELTATTTWDPGSIADGAQDATVVTLTGAAKGDICGAGFTSIDDFWEINATPDTDQVQVRITNRSGAPVDPASGTVRVVCKKY